MSNLLLLGIGILVSLLCLSGIIFAVLHVHRLIDSSRVHPRYRSEKSIDDDGIFTQLTPDQRDSVHLEHDRLAHSKIKNVRLRSDLPPLSRDPRDTLPPEDDIEEEWIEEIHSPRETRPHP